MFDKYSTKGLVAFKSSANGACFRKVVFARRLDTLSPLEYFTSDSWTDDITEADSLKLDEADELFYNKIRLDGYEYIIVLHQEDGDYLNTTGLNNS